MNSFFRLYFGKQDGGEINRRRNLRFDIWRFITILIALISLIPFGVVMSSFFFPADEIWRHLYDTILFEVIINTLLLVAGTAIGSFIIGVPLAWVNSIYTYPGRKIFEWTLMLPLAIPAYVTAFVAIGLLDYTGSIQTYLRGLTGGELSFFPAIRSRAGVIVVLTLTLYPYVYLLARNAFLTQGKRSLEVAQSLGYSGRMSFLKAALPMARPWIIGGVLLVVMETLADFGAVYIFNYDTLTTTIYKAWFGFFSINAASQIASILVIFVFVIMIFEQYSRSRMRYYSNSNTKDKDERIKLIGGKAVLAFVSSSIILLLAFIIPVAQLSVWGMKHLQDEFDYRYISLLWNSFSLSTMAAVITLLCALILAYGNRVNKDKLNLFLVKGSTLGYAFPGAVLAVGIFIPFAWFDNTIIDFFKNTFNYNPGFIMQGTLITILTAYVIRFLAVSYNSVESSMQRITPSLDESAISFGLSKLQILKQIHLPLIKGGIYTAIILVFVDVMKEMPITLMTRPFGWDTLAIRIFEKTSEGNWESAAIPALTLILAGLIPLKFLMKHSE